ncbi:MAG: ATP synthase F1 subunit epsilon [Candidatus Magasanikbacteria bacterium]|jgi:F-type H+-transporting ATPase subunit epsilon
MSKINFKVVTPEKVIYENAELDQITVPTTTGEITILPNHIPLVTLINAGELLFKDKTGDHHFAVAGGFLEVKENNEVVLLADNAESATDIDLLRAEQAIAKAQQQMSELKNKEDVDYTRLQAVIDRETNRMRVGKKYKHLPKPKEE